MPSDDVHKYNCVAQKILRPKIRGASLGEISPGTFAITVKSSPYGLVTLVEELVRKVNSTDRRCDICEVRDDSNSDLITIAILPR